MVASQRFGLTSRHVGDGENVGHAHLLGFTWSDKGCKHCMHLTQKELSLSLDRSHCIITLNSVNEVGNAGYHGKVSVDLNRAAVRLAAAQYIQTH